MESRASASSCPAHCVGCQAPVNSAGSFRLVCPWANSDTRKPTSQPCAVDLRARSGLAGASASSVLRMLRPLELASSSASTDVSVASPSPSRSRPSTVSSRARNSIPSSLARMRGESGPAASRVATRTGVIGAPEESTKRLLSRGCVGAAALE